MAYRLGVDIGGTFTDIALIDEATGQIYTGKVSSTPQDPSGGFMEAVQRLLAKQQIAAQDVAYIVHGTTVATNAIIEGKVAPTGFITTEGFRDMLEIARQIRPTLYDLQFEKPRPLVPRHHCFGVPERLDAQGQVLAPLDEDALRRVANKLRDEGVEAIAVCFLHAYANPAHERRAGEIIAEVFPEAVVSLSAEVAPEFREYLRASTTVINSCIRPVVARYLQRIEDRLAQTGIAAELLVMQSSGGVYTFAAARQKPVYMVESGPAAGVIAAAHLGQARGYDQVISFDMGGTTAKVGLIQGGTPNVTKDYEVGTTAQTGVGATRGAGYPIRTPVIDLVEIGAGGGSIAWVDPGGILRVGPQSAGADPGPACYGQGGTQPTVTDANLVLGRLNPSYFLGGEIALDPTAAQRAIEQHCAQPLGMDLVEAAHGIVEIANTAMVNALRLVSVQRGYDPRDFALVAFGGAGPASRQSPRRSDRYSRGDHSPKSGHGLGAGTIGDGLKTRLRDHPHPATGPSSSPSLGADLPRVRGAGARNAWARRDGGSGDGIQTPSGSALRWAEPRADAAVGNRSLGFSAANAAIGTVPPHARSRLWL